MRDRGRLLTPYNSFITNIGNPSLVKRVQRGTCTFSSGSSSTATIAAVDTNNTIVRYLGSTQAQNNNNWAVQFARASLTNSTTVTIDVGVTIDTFVASFEVIEYFPGVIKRIQRGSITIADGVQSNTATISAVDMNKTELTMTGFWSSTGAAPNSWDGPKMVLTNATTITVNRGATGTAGISMFPYYQIVEFF